MENIDKGFTVPKWVLISDKLVKNKHLAYFNPKFKNFFWLEQTNWAEKFWGIFGQFISTHFGTVSPLSMFFINQPLFLQKIKSLYPNPIYL